MNETTEYTRHGSPYTYSFPDDETEQLGEFCGVGSMDALREWFSGCSTVSEVQASCDQCWPGEDNSGLAQRIWDALNHTYYNVKEAD